MGRQDFKLHEKVWAIERRESCPSLTYEQLAEEFKRHFGHSDLPGVSTVKRWLSLKHVLLAEHQKDPKSDRKRALGRNKRKSEFEEALARWVRNQHSLGKYPKQTEIGAQGARMLAVYEISGLKCLEPWVCKFMKRHKLPIGPHNVVTDTSSMPQRSSEQLDQTQECVSSDSMFITHISWFCNIALCASQPIALDFDLWKYAPPISINSLMQEQQGYFVKP